MDRCIFYSNEVRTAAYFPELCGRAIVIDIGKFVTLGKYRLADLRYRARNKHRLERSAFVKCYRIYNFYTFRYNHILESFTTTERMLANFFHRAGNNDAFQALAGIERLSSEICYSLGKSNAIYIFTPEQRTLADAGYAFFYHAFLN